MSRIGNLPIKIPQWVEVLVSDNEIKVKWPKGELILPLGDFSLSFKEEEGNFFISRDDEKKFTKSIHWTVRSILSSMIKGVSEWFEKKLQVVGIGYKVELKWQDLQFSLGYSHPIVIKKIKDI